MSSTSRTTFPHLEIPNRIAPPPQNHRQPDGSTTQYTLEPLGRFSSLPSELLLNIFEDLEQDDRICLALTCKRMRSFLGPSIRWYAEHDTYDTFAHQRFLSRYARDLPGWIACFACLKLHPIDSIDRPGPWNERTMIGLHRWDLPSLPKILLYHFDFLGLKMIMNEYQATGSTARVEDLRSTHVQDSAFDNGTVFKKLTSIDAKIIDGALFMRMQEMIDINECRRAWLQCNSSPIKRGQFPMLNFCQHRGWFGPFYFPMGHPIYGTHLNGHPNGYEQTLHCTICGMNGASMTWHDGAAYAMTRWIRLGTGAHLDANDPIWFPVSRQTLDPTRGNPAYSSDGRTWQDIYERDAEQPWKKLLEVNLWLLGQTR